MEQKKEPMLRIYDSLKNFVGENKVYKYGDVLFVSTESNEVYDTILLADGKHSFCDLLRAKEEESYDIITDPSQLQNEAGKDIIISTAEVADAFSASQPYFKDIVVRGVEVGKTVTMKATDRITFDNIVVSGGKDVSNGKVIYAAKNIELKNIKAEENSTLYNAFEGYQSANDPQYTGLEYLAAVNIDIDCPSITHNIINVYTPASGAEIIVKDSKFNITVDNTNPLRLANYMNAENVTVIFDNVDWTYENGVTKNDWRWAGLVIFQPSASDVALNGDLSKIKTWNFFFKNCRYNGQKITENSFGQHNQAFYLYDIGHTNQVTDPDEAGIRLWFE